MPYYAVKYRNGQGQIFTDWDSCRRAVTGVSGVSHMKFDTHAEAERFIEGDKRPHMSAYQRHAMVTDYVNRFGWENLEKQLDLEPYAIYCDGCYLGDGRAGYGVYISPNDPRNISKPVKVRERNSFVAEVFAVRAALKLLVNEFERYYTKYSPKFVLYTDSEVVVRLMNNYIATNNKYFDGPGGQELREAYALYNKVRKFYRDRAPLFNDHEFEIRWTRGHAGLEGNEMADRLARAGALKLPAPQQPATPVFMTGYLVVDDRY